MDVACIFFGVPEGFSTTHQEYDQLLFKYYQSGRSGTEFSVKIVENRSFASYVNYDFFAKDGRPGSLFGICLSFDGAIPVDLRLLCKYLVHLFDEIHATTEYFSRPKAGVLHQYKINAISQTNFSKHINTIQKSIHEMRLVENLVTFKPVIINGATEVMSFDESFVNILEALLKGKVLVFSEETKPKAAGENWKKIGELKVFQENALAQRVTQNEELQAQNEELQGKFNSFREELVTLVNRWNSDSIIVKSNHKNNTDKTRQNKEEVSTNTTKQEPIETNKADKLPHKDDFDQFIFYAVYLLLAVIVVLVVVFVVNYR